MKKWLLVSFAALTLSLSLSVGITTALYAPASLAETSHAVIAQAGVENQDDAVVSIVEDEAPKFCKDEAGQPKQCDNGDFLEAIGGAVGLKGLALAYAIVQALLFFLFSPAGVKMVPIASVGAWKFTIAFALNLVAGILSLKLSTTLDWGAILTNSTTLAAYAVLGNQAFKQFFVKKN